MTREKEVKMRLGNIQGLPNTESPSQISVIRKYKQRNLGLSSHCEENLKDSHKGGKVKEAIPNSTYFL